MKSGNLNFLEPSGPLQACNGTALAFYIFIFYLYIGKQFSSEVTEGGSRQIAEPAVAHQLLCIYQGTKMLLTLSYLCT